MAILSFLFPIFGWIMWGVKKDTNPEEAGKCLTWANIGFGLGMVFFILF